MVRLNFNDAATEIVTGCAPEHVALVGLHFDEVDVPAKFREGFRSKWRFVDEFIQKVEDYRLVAVMFYSDEVINWR